MSKKQLNHSTSFKTSQEDFINVINYPSTRTSGLYIDSTDINFGGYEKSTYENTNNLIPLQISRLGLKYINMSYRIPNMNPLNNIFKFLIDGNPTEILFAFGTTDWLDPQTMFMAIKQEMQTEALSQVGVVLVVDFTRQNGTDVWSMTSSIPIQFQQSIGITYGGNLHGMKYTPDGYFSEMLIIPRMYYTSYIDILISEIRDNSIVPHKFSSNKRFAESEHISRIYIPFVNRITDNNEVIARQMKEFARENVNINYYAFRHRDVNSFQITLIDEFENVIATENQVIDLDNPEGQITNQIEFLKYNIVLSIIE